MRVRLTFGEKGEIYIEPAFAYGGGSVSGSMPIVVRPGESWRGWKYRRLRGLGEGEHALVAKSDTIREAGGTG